MSCTVRPSALYPSCPSTGEVAREADTTQSLDSPPISPHNSEGSDIYEHRPEVTMALDVHAAGSTLGCAFFTSSTGLLELAEEITMADNEVIEQFIIHVQPTIILVSSRAPKWLLNHVKELNWTLDQHSMSTGRTSKNILTNEIRT